MTSRWLLALAAAAALAGVAPAAAATWYVNGARGKDGNSGASADQALRTLKQGVDRAAPGDVVRVASGVYYEPMPIERSGADGRPILITGDGPTRPVVKNLDDAIRISGSYVDLVGFEAVSLGEGSAIALAKGAHHVRVAGSIARDSGCGGIAGQQNDYVVIEDNVVHGNAMRSPYQCSGISLYQAKAVDDRPGFHNIIRRNISYANMNLVVDDKISQSGGHTTDGNGIIIDDFRNTQDNKGNPRYLAATLVENNLVFDNGGRGIHVFLSDNIVIRNNTSYMNLKDKNLLGPRNGEISAVKAGNVEVVGNIAMPRDKKMIALIDASTSGDRWENNLTFGGIAFYSEHSDARQSHNQDGVDPMLRAPGIDPAADFHPRPESPAVGAGRATDAPLDDLERHPRPTGRRPTLGALEPPA